MQGWRRELQFAAVGIAAAAATELLSHQQSSRAHCLGRLLVAGGVATAYAHLVPSPSWGVRSGAAFAQLPLVASVQRGLPGRPLPFAFWGGLTGLLLRCLWPAVQ